MVVRVGAAAAQLDACLDAIKRNTGGTYTLVLASDADPESALGRTVARCAERHGAVVSWNAGDSDGLAALRDCPEIAPSADVAVLEDSVRVGPRWLENLRIAAYSGDDIAAAYAVAETVAAEPDPDEVARLSRLAAQTAERNHADAALSRDLASSCAAISGRRRISRRRQMERSRKIGGALSTTRPACWSSGTARTRAPACRGT